jgi:hypothetical protein
MVMGGDFNLIRYASEKNNDNINQGLMDQFNMFIHLHQKMRAKKHMDQQTIKSCPWIEKPLKNQRNRLGPVFRKLSSQI